MNFSKIIENIKEAEFLRTEVDSLKIIILDMKGTIRSRILTATKVRKYNEDIAKFKSEIVRFEDELKLLINKWMVFDRQTLETWVNLHKKTCTGIIQKTKSRKKYDNPIDIARYIYDFWDNIETRHTEIIHFNEDILDYNSQFDSMFKRWIETLPENRPDCAG